MRRRGGAVESSDDHRPAMRYEIAGPAGDAESDTTWVADAFEPDPTDDAAYWVRFLEVPCGDDARDRLGDVSDMGEVVVLPLPAHTAADPVDDPGHDPTSALEELRAALCGLGTMRILGRVRGQRELGCVVGRAVRVVELGSEGEGRPCVLLRWRGGMPSVEVGELIEVVGEWELVGQHLVLDVDDLLFVD